MLQLDWLNLDHGTQVHHPKTKEKMEKGYCLK